MSGLLGGRCWFKYVIALNVGDVNSSAAVSIRAQGTRCATVQGATRRFDLRTEFGTWCLDMREITNSRKFSASVQNIP